MKAELSYLEIEKLNVATNWNFRLQTEAEWEYAARGGELTDGSIYSGKNILDTIGWYNVNSENKLHPVAQKESNQLGLYDMSGNVWEWCQDVYESQYKEGARKSMFSLERLPIENPQGGIVGDYRVIRGGSFSSKDSKCWVFYREKKSPWNQVAIWGLDWSTKYDKTLLWLKYSLLSV